MPQPDKPALSHEELRALDATLDRFLTNAYWTDHIGWDRTLDAVDEMKRLVDLALEAPSLEGVGS